ncbi:MAG: NAD(+)/NADH kinase [Haloarculaceae archaeon]
MRVGVVAQRANRRAAGLAADIRRSIEASVRVDEATADALDVEGIPVEEMADSDLVVSIGGDGTFLYAARGVDGAPVMGVNLGEVGFLNGVPPDEAVETVRAAVERIRETGSPRVRELPRVRASGEGWSLPPAMNEVAVMGSRRGRGGGVGVEVRVDGSLYGGTHADGVLVSTPTGSTAYNLSEGGPLVHPDVGALLVTEMCAVDPMPSLAVPLGAELTVRVDDAPAAVVVGDGRATRELEPPAQVSLGVADDPVRVAGPPLDFFAALGKLD